MNKKIKFLLAGICFGSLLVGCESTNVDELAASVSRGGSSSVRSVLDVFSLGECDESKEGSVVYVETEDSRYRCQAGDWEPVSATDVSYSEEDDPVQESSSSQAQNGESKEPTDPSGNPVVQSSASEVNLEPDATFFIDPRDNQRYSLVYSNSLAWFGRNLNYEQGGSLCYEDDVSFCLTYGRLYKYDNALLACPEGWRLPTSEEWNASLDDLEVSEAFELLGGFFFSGRYVGEHERGYYWSSTESSSQGKVYLQIMSSSGWTNMNIDKSVAASVRCVRSI